MDSKAEGEGYWKREWVKLVDRPPATKVKPLGHGI